MGAMGPTPGAGLQLPLGSWGGTAARSHQSVSSSPVFQLGN